MLGGAASARGWRRESIASTKSWTSSRSRLPAVKAVEATMALRHARRWLCSAHFVSGRNIGSMIWFMVTSRSALLLNA
jgi:hypothetical protein